MSVFRESIINHSAGPRDRTLSKMPSRGGRSGAFGRHMALKVPASPCNGNPLEREANGCGLDGETAVPEHVRVHELLSLPDFDASFPPQAVAVAPEDA
jgi:hypothetical protein